MQPFILYPIGREFDQKKAQYYLGECIHYANGICYDLVANSYETCIQCSFKISILVLDQSPPPGI